MARLLVRLLGSLQVTLDGRPVTGFESDKERALLAFLAEEARQPQRREKLAGLLWPELSEASARNNLRRSLSNLRRLLGDRTPAGAPFLQVTHQTIQLNPAGDTWVDSPGFANAVDPPGEQAVATLEAAVGLYRGTFLDGFSLAGSPAFEEWALLCREHYRRLMLEALHRLVQHHEAGADLERALHLAWMQVELEPWWEEANQQVIRLLALSGRRSEALAQYAKCRQLLADELGVAPSAQTTALYQSIAGGTLVASRGTTRLRVAPTHNLPLAPGRFVGREAEVQRIHACLQDPDCRLLTLVGPGGIGKTRLTLEAVSRWLSQVEDHDLEHIALVSLAPLSESESLVAAIAQVTGLHMGQGGGSRQQLVDHLREKRLLLILDSFEHLLDARDLLVDVLTTAPRVKILATSRARLNLRGETVLPLSGMGFPTHACLDAEEAGRFSAVELFLVAARQVRLGFEPSAADWVSIGRICRQVQGMPLALLLAAAWMGLLGPAEIADEIGRSLGVLAADWADVPERQRSMQAVFDRSWSLLTERQRELFAALSVFPGGFTRAAAQWVTGATLHELKSLADRSLLQITPAGRYEIHDLLRLYAADRLETQPGLASATRDRHAAYYAEALRRWQSDSSGSPQQAALAEMKAEFGNFRAAWDWALQHAQAELLDRAMEGFENFHWQSGRYRESAVAMGDAAAAMATAAETAPHRVVYLRVRVRALAWQATSLRAMGQRDEARGLQQQCLAILNDPALEGCNTHLERAVLSYSMGVTDCMADYAQGKQRFEESYRLFRELDNRWGMAWTLNASGSMSMFLGVYSEAEQRVEEALAVYRALGNAGGVSASLSRLATIATATGRFEKGEDLAREAVATAREGGYRSELAFAQLQLGGALEKGGRFSEAHAALRQSLDLYRELGQHTYITEARSLLACVELHLGRYHEACGHAEAALSLARAQGPRYCVGQSLLLLGCLELAKGTAFRAQQLLEESVGVYRQVGGNPDDLACALASLSLVAQRVGDRHGAREHLRQALEVAVGTGAVSPRYWALPAAALLLGADGAIERAVELYALASRYPLVANSSWFQVVVGKRIAEAAASLLPEVADAARERGQARDVDATVDQLLAELRGQASP